MTNLWQRVSRSAPCAVCGKPDWCTVGHRFRCCMRVQSDRPAANGGWFHPLNSLLVETAPKRTPEPPVDVRPMLRNWSFRTDKRRLFFFAESLGVSIESVIRLNTLWAPEHSA